MTFSKTPEIAHLIILKNALVARRRQLAESAARLHLDPDNATDDTAGSGHGPDILKIQLQIEAVDKAIADEKQMVSGQI